jgi:TrmH family RNA methyltransferase
VLEKLAAKENPQNLMGVFEQRWSALPEVQSLAKSALWVALDEIRAPGNLGTIIRTVDAVGADGIILIGNCCDPYQREAVRATMGSLFAVPLVKVERATFVEWATSWPGDRVGTHLDAAADYREGNYEGRSLLVMGREGPGMSDEVAAVCNRLVKIPMAGKLDSLNLAVATALMLYEIKRGALKLTSPSPRATGRGSG